jgi:hypothetical protein
MESIDNKHIPSSLAELVNKVKENPNELDDLVLNIRTLIDAHAHSLSEPSEPKSIIESRFTPAEEAFEKGFTSCGAMANMSAETLRQLGYTVKLIHGESKESVDHAWIYVHNPITDSWKEYDLTREYLDVPSTHVKKEEVDSWEEMRDKIESDYETMIERRRERGLS